jgi:hypothetical protein
MEDAELVGVPSDTPPPEAPEADICDPATFMEATKDYDNLYVSLLGDNCNACGDFKDELRKTEVPHPVIEISADQCPRLADHFGARVVPTVVLLQKGKVVGTYEGAGAIEKMRQGS